MLNEFTIKLEENARKNLEQGTLELYEFSIVSDFLGNYIIENNLNADVFDYIEYIDFYLENEILGIEEYNRLIALA